MPFNLWQRQRICLNHHLLWWTRRKRKLHTLLSCRKGRCDLFPNVECDVSVCPAIVFQSFSLLLMVYDAMTASSLPYLNVALSFLNDFSFIFTRESVVEFVEWEDSFSFSHLLFSWKLFSFISFVSSFPSFLFYDVLRKNICAPDSLHKEREEFPSRKEWFLSSWTIFLYSTF